MSGNAGQSKELVRLLAIPRKRGDEELRLTLDEFTPADGGEPSQYVSCRLWYRAHGEYRPTQKGVTIRRGELAKMLEALQRAEHLLTGKESLPASRSMRAESDDQDRSAEMDIF